MNLKVVFLLAVVSVLESCDTTSLFFNEWEKESLQIVSTPTKTDLEKNIQDISTILCCTPKSEKGHRYPKIKYKIVNEHIKVAVVKTSMNHPKFRKFTRKNLSWDTLQLWNDEPKYWFEDSLFTNKPICDTNSLSPLLFFEKYQQIVPGKLKKGFGSSSGINEKKALVVVESHHTNPQYFSSHFELNSITFNTTLDTAIVLVSSLYSGSEYRYVKKENIWVQDELLYHLTE